VIWLLVPIAFVVLVTLRSAGLVLGIAKSEDAGAEKGKVTPMVHVTWMLCTVAETAWALGTSVLAGLPLLT
jgi:hypothetical protein